ncbi:MAG: hypothetical protein NTW87_13915 [Planctomycetota bacterium]|nr:hypothetical protein [Planctomycetota bacterium]
MLRVCVLSGGLILTRTSSAADFVSEDIATGKAGNTTPVGADGFDVSGSGKDIWDSSDGFRFVYQKLSGDFEIRARVVSLQNTNEWAKAGLMVRQATAAGSIHAMLAVTFANGCAFQRRTEADGESTSTAGPAAQAGNTWLRLVRAGKTVTAYVATDEQGKKWEQVGDETLEMG